MVWVHTSLNDNPDVVMNETCWAASWMDVDCNGWEDLHVTTGIAAFTDYPSVLFQYPNAYDALFMNEMGELSEDEARLMRASSLGFSTATGDLNQDGFPDLVSHSIGGTAKVWSGIPNDNGWIKIRPVGTSSNRDGVGTKIELWIEGVPLYRETYCGENYLGQNSRWEHFGLGVETSIDSMQVEWSSGIVDVYYNVMANQSLVITEGETASQCQGSCLGCTYRQRATMTRTLKTMTALVSFPVGSMRMCARMELFGMLRCSNALRIVRQTWMGTARQY